MWRRNELAAERVVLVEMAEAEVVEAKAGFGLITEVAVVDFELEKMKQTLVDFGFAKMPRIEKMSTV